jgi:hypothetical protein
MKLTPKEVAIMVKVRENMQRAYEQETSVHQYICWNILEAVVGRNTMYDGPSLPDQMKQIGGDAERLYRHITWALGGHGTMTNFIGNQTMHLGYKFTWWARKFDREARLAWLDRIIEMEDIK